MNDFKKSRFGKDAKPGGFSRPSFGGARRPQARSFGEQTETFKTSCSKCHAACEVPFRPNGKKPVFCKNCFVRDDSRPTGNSYEKRSYNSERPAAPAPQEDARIGAMQKELGTIHAKLDALIKALEGSAYDSILTASKERDEKPKKAVAAKKVTKKKAA